MRLDSRWLGAGLFASLFVLSCGTGDGSDTQNPSLVHDAAAGSSGAGHDSGADAEPDASANGGSAGSNVAGSGGAAGAAGVDSGAAGEGGDAGTAGAEAGTDSAGAGGGGEAGAGGADAGPGDAEAGFGGGSAGPDASVGGSGGQAGEGGAQAGAGGDAGHGVAGSDAGDDANTGDDAGTDAEAGCTDNAGCDDGVYCNGTETCEEGTCVPGVPVLCDDGIDCTADFCNESTGACEAVGQDTLCVQDYCDGPMHCVPGQGCVSANEPINCDDGVACTVDVCDNAEQRCISTPNHELCPSDGNFCNGPEMCDATKGCVSGPAPNCDDGLACTIDSCDYATGCVYLPNSALCDDGVYCNGREECVVGQGCVDGPDPCSDDGISCTIECEENGPEHCNIPSNALCSGQFCVPVLGGCVDGIDCTTDAECDDLQVCNGQEQCVSGQCVSGVPLDCSDGIDCTIDLCEDPGGTCVHIPSDGVCSDGDGCNGRETCSPTEGCLPGTPPDCDDGVACTFDSCVPETGLCSHAPDHSMCDNGLYCDGEERCTAHGCESEPFDCPDDGIACTTERCDEAVQACVSVPDDSMCAQYESCSIPHGGCANTCVVTACQGHVYACGDCIDNDNDGKMDSKDEHCLGPCDNSENHLFHEIPGGASPACKPECYFDQDSGEGNDDCAWDHRCDPLENPDLYSPIYPEENCTYNPSLVGTETCPDQQSATCLSFCGPLTPNGCDCFGCCDIRDPAHPDRPNFVFLGSIDYGDNKTRTCTLDVANDPTKCHPCTPVQDCLNTCEHCELCIGQQQLPPECSQQECPAGLQPCGLPGQGPCPSLHYCISGCCQPVPQ